jgi:hypothetical protein
MQIQNAHNYTRMAIGELTRLQRQMEKNEGRPEARSLIDALQVRVSPSIIFIFYLIF